MYKNPVDRIKAIDKKIVLQHIIEFPASIMLGLWLYAKFAANGDAFIPILNNQTILNGMLVIGFTIIAWSGYKVVCLSREKARIKIEHNL